MMGVAVTLVDGAPGAAAAQSQHDRTWYLLAKCG
jgi:hypothetical protein